LSAPPLEPGLRLRLSGMMFLQYAIWGAWLPLFYGFVTEHRGLAPEEAGTLFAVGAIGALFAPFIAGQIADRWFNTEKFLALSHLLGAVLVWELARLETYGQLLVFGLLYSLVYAPTLPLTNSLAFHHLPDRDRDFGKVRVWGTVGWIVVGIGIGQWLLHRHTPEEADRAAVRAAQVAGMADSFRLSAILGVVQGLFCFTLPPTPPRKGRERFAPWEALREVGRPPLLTLFLISFPIAVVHQFYFVHTAGFLGTLEHPWAEKINALFGVGGGGLMTIGQMAEIAVLAAMPVVAKSVSRKSLLLTGLCAYVLRFFVFAYLPTPAAVLPALALHGLCFGCFFFVAFMIVDEETSPDVRASAQGLFNLVIVGLGVIGGNYFAGKIAAAAGGDYRHLFSVPMYICVACFVLLLLFYPARRARGTEAPAAI
jgi:nucleoside transporter